MLTYLRIDGSTQFYERGELIARFNDVKNSSMQVRQAENGDQVKAFLLSAKVSRVIVLLLPSCIRQTQNSYISYVAQGLWDWDQPRRCQPGESCLSIGRWIFLDETNLFFLFQVVLFDNHFNPTVLTQALYRSYRYGQTKPVFAYRFMTEGSVEEKIYSRSVNKTGVALRVIDGKSITRSFTERELRDLEATDTWVQCDR